MYRFARIPALASAVCFVLIAVGASVSAQENSFAPQPVSLLTDGGVDRAIPIFLENAKAMQPASPSALRQSLEIGGRARRPGALIPLYISFASLQGLDAHSTTRALDRGGYEANPLMRGLAAHPLGLVAVKAAATTGVVYAGEKMWKRNKVAAVVFMVAANSAMAWVVQHNYRAVQ